MSDVNSFLHDLRKRFNTAYNIIETVLTDIL